MLVERLGISGVSVIDELILCYQLSSIALNVCLAVLLFEHVCLWALPPVPSVLVFLIEQWVTLMRSGL
jgi:hypothetical protein